MKQFGDKLWAAGIVERIKTNSVLNPLLWLAAIIAASAIPAALLSADGVQIFFCALAALPVVVAIVAYFIWMFLDPDRLQSEDYQLEQHKLLQGSKEENNLPITYQTSDHPPPQITNEDALSPDEPSSHAALEDSDSGDD